MRTSRKLYQHYRCFRRQIVTAGLIMTSGFASPPTFCPTMTSYKTYRRKDDTLHHRSTIKWHNGPRTDLKTTPITHNGQQRYHLPSSPWPSLYNRRPQRLEGRQTNCWAASGEPPEWIRRPYRFGPAGSVEVNGVRYVQLELGCIM